MVVFGNVLRNINTSKIKNVNISSALGNIDHLPCAFTSEIITDIFFSLAGGCSSSHALPSKRKWTDDQKM